MNHRFALYLSLAGCVVLGALLFVEITAPAPGAAPTLPPVRPAAAAATVRVPPSPQLDQLVATTLARPLFSATRRPQPATDANDSGGDDLGNMRLTGIVVAPDHRLAIFAVTGAKPLAVKQGGDVSGWRVEGITSREVSLSGPGGIKTLQPKPDAALARARAREPNARAAAFPPHHPVNLPGAGNRPVPPVPIVPPHGRRLRR